MVNAKMNRKTIWKLTVLLIVFMMFIGSAQAFTIKDLYSSGNNNEKLKNIDEKVGSISGNMRLMKFINSNMFDQDVEAIGIYITENDNILRTYYVIRGKDKSGAASISEDVPGEEGIWKFNPDVGQSIKGLDLAEEGFNLYDDRHSLGTKSKIPYFLLRTLFLYSRVDNENIPSLSEMIEKSNCGKCKKALKLI